MTSWYDFENSNFEVEHEEKMFVELQTPTLGR